MRISDWSSDVCSSDLLEEADGALYDPPANGSGRPRRLLYDDGDGDQNFRNSDRGIRSDSREPGRFEAVHVAHPIRATTPRPNIPGINRKSVVEGKSVSVRVDIGGRRSIKKKKK